MQVPELEKKIGIEVYATHTQGIGGTIRKALDDFIVEEVLVDGSKASASETEKTVGSRALGASSRKSRYLLCVLVKRNWDTLIAVRNVARELGLSTGQVQFGGIKDAKAVTAQYITVENVAPEDLQKVQVKDIELTPIGYVPNKLSAYYLLGNNFHIAIRNLEYSEHSIRKATAEAVEELNEEGGIPNFFGHQRFGTTRAITHRVGKAIIKANLREAAMIFLAEPSPHEHPSSRQARKQLQDTQDFKQALRDFPKQLRYERAMLKRLAEEPDDYAGALRRLPKKLRELFVQAYQSYLFNRFLSKRIKEGVPLNKTDVGDCAVNVERSGLPLITMYRIVSEAVNAEVNNKIKTAKMRLAIPLIGFKQRPMLGRQGIIEKQILEEEGVSIEDFKVTALPEVAEKGKLRTAATPIHGFSIEEAAHEKAKNIARLAFMLYRGSYATVLLREIMKPSDIISQGF
jgi:tRNA pseudouridine13 synthase